MHTHVHTHDGGTCAVTDTWETYMGTPVMEAHTGTRTHPRDGGAHTTEAGAQSQIHDGHLHGRARDGGP